MPVGPRIELREIFAIAERANDLRWEPFRDGVEIHRLYGNGNSGASAALLRFRAGGSIPFHRHEGYEQILVLTGTQVDDHGTIGAGTLVINPPGTEHRVTSTDGCIVLAIYECPVSFV